MCCLAVLQYYKYKRPEHARNIFFTAFLAFSNKSYLPDFLPQKVLTRAQSHKGRK